MINLSVIILSYTNSSEIHAMNLQCIESLINSEDFKTGYGLEIIVVESNKNYFENGFHFPSNVKVIVPGESFNFHRFLNIGVNNSSYEYVALCNNDLIFNKNWFTEIVNVAKKNPKIKSFSPIDAGENVDTTKDFQTGYQIRTYIKGWCFVVKRELFKTIGLFDETFDFYYADDDYSMTLRKHKIPHALVHNSVVQHLGGANTDTIRAEGNIDFKAITSKHPDLPKYLFKEDYKWVLKNEKYLDGHLKFHKKWGSPRWIGLKNRIQKILPPND